MLILPVEDLYTLCELVSKNAQFFYSINSCFILYCMLYIYTCIYSGVIREYLLSEPVNTALLLIKLKWNVCEFNLTSFILFCFNQEVAKFRLIMKNILNCCCCLNISDILILICLIIVLIGIHTMQDWYSTSWYLFFCSPQGKKHNVDF